MLSHPFRLATLAALLSVGSLNTDAQAHPAAVVVHVESAETNPAKPVYGSSVRLSYLINKQRIRDAQHPTDDHGNAILAVSPDVTKTGAVRLEVINAQNLVILYPADGQFTVLPPTINLTLVHQKSPLLLAPAQLEAKLKQLSLQLNAARNQNRELEEDQKSLSGEVHTAHIGSASTKPSGPANDPAAAARQQNDLSSAIAAWAASVGWDVDTVTASVKQWAEQVQQHPDASSPNQRALAEFALGDFSAAAGHFHQGAAALAAKEDAEEEAEDRAHQQAVAGYLSEEQQSANSYRLAGDYHFATKILQGAADYTTTKAHRYPDNTGIEALREQATAELADAEGQEAAVQTGKPRADLLAAARTLYQQLQSSYRAADDKVADARIKVKLADLLVTQSAPDKPGARDPQLKTADGMYTEALTVLSQKYQPEDWANAQVALSAVRVERSKTRYEGAAALTAIQPLEKAELVYTKASHVLDWARVESDLGEAYSIAGQLSASQDELKYNIQAEQHLRLALNAQSRQSCPLDWASTNSYLADTLAHRGGWIFSGDDSKKTDSIGLLRGAIQAERDALTVYSQTSTPVPWANTQFALSFDLAWLADDLSAPDQLPVLREAADRFTQGRQVYNDVDFPAQQLVMTSDSRLGMIEESIGNLLSGSDAMSAYEQALAAYRISQRSWDQTKEPAQWAFIHAQIARIISEEGIVAPEESRPALLDSAEQEYQASVEAYDQDQGSSDEMERWRLTCIKEYNELEFSRKKPRIPTSVFEAGIDHAEHHAFVIELLGSFFHDQIFRFDDAYDLNARLLKLEPTDGHRMDYIESALSASHPDVCLAERNNLRQAKLDPALQLILDTLALACEWEAGSSKTDSRTFTTVQSEIDQAKANSWNFAGTLYFLKHSPQFETQRDAWVQLFTALQSADNSGMKTALQELKPSAGK